MWSALHERQEDHRRGGRAEERVHDAADGGNSSRAFEWGNGAHADAGAVLGTAAAVLANRQGRRGAPVHAAAIHPTPEARPPGGAVGGVTRAAGAKHAASHAARA